MFIYTKINQTWNNTYTHTDSRKHTETTPQKPALPAGGVMTEGNKSLLSYVIIVQMIIGSLGGRWWLVAIGGPKFYPQSHQLPSNLTPAEAEVKLK